MSKQKTKIPEGWKEINLGKIIKFQGGFAFKTADYKESGIPLVRIGNIGKGSFINDNFVYITEKMFDECRSFQLHNNDILMGMTGDLGKVCKIKNVNLPALLNQRVGRIIIKNTNEVNSSYIYQLFLSNDLQKKFEKYFEGMAQKNISSGQIESTEILLPPLPVQNKIAEILETVDEEIEKVEGIIERGEKIKNGILQKNFVYPVKGFKKVKIKDVALVNPKADLKLPDEAVVGFISMADVSNEANIEKIQAKLFGQVKKGFTKFLSGDILFAKITPCMENGKGGLNLDNNYPVYFGSTEFHILRATKKINSKFLYYLVSNKYFRQIASKHMTGTAGQRRVPKEFLENYFVNLPNIEDQNKIANTLFIIDNKILVYKNIKNNLIQLKKGLAADLLSGKVDI